MSIKTLLEDEIKTEIEELGRMDTGSDGYKVAVDGVTKLMDRVIEMDRLKADQENKSIERDIQTDLKLKELEDEKKHKIIGNIITGVSVVGGFALTVWGAKKSWEFEKEGTITSSFGRMFMNCFRPKK